jgi:hypothetical protein
VFCFDFNVYMVSSLDRERERKAEQFVGMDWKLWWDLIGNRPNG